jgi:hypothetical protein
MKQNKFLVKIPKPDNPEEFSEHRFSTIDEIASFLEVSQNTLYSLRTGRLKMVHTSKKKLDGVTIEKLPVFYAAKKNHQEINEKIKDFRKRKCETILK